MISGARIIFCVCWFCTISCCLKLQLRNLETTTIHQPFPLNHSLRISYTLRPAREEASPTRGRVPNCALFLFLFFVSLPSDLPRQSDLRLILQTEYAQRAFLLPTNAQHQTAEGTLNILIFILPQIMPRPTSFTASHKFHHIQQVLITAKQSKKDAGHNRETTLPVKPTSQY